MLDCLILLVLDYVFDGGVLPVGLTLEDVIGIMDDIRMVNSVVMKGILVRGGALGRVNDKAILADYKDYFGRFVRAVGLNVQLLTATAPKQMYRLLSREDCEGMCGMGSDLCGDCHSMYGCPLGSFDPADSRRFERSFSPYNALVFVRLGPTLLRDVRKRLDVKCEGMSKTSLVFMDGKTQLPVGMSVFPGTKPKKIKHLVVGVSKQVVLSLADIRQIVNRRFRPQYRDAIMERLEWQMDSPLVDVDRQVIRERSHRAEDGDIW